MTIISVPENLWAASMLPAGVLERWRVRDGQRVAAGEVIAELRIEDCLHELLAPAAGRRRGMRDGDVIEPGARIGLMDSAR